MLPLKRQLFICSEIEQCQEKTNCCAHKTPHIKDERCIPRECRYAPGAENVDCDPVDPENPRTPIPVPVAPAKTVENVLKAKYVIAEPVKEPVKEVSVIESVKTISKETEIKEAVKKQAAAPKKGSKKKAGES